ncbi:hypothetical protein CXG81DRAFT_17721 [Caulochytrium protostelioides]|uniref:Striatin N-terminal domain-containing protein n=1 Tax=Caulochytrium protostelioides TaxID=1555241 RepID=A0A4P9XB97_9FUNG|nr:hypothetical protein CXG81DRAFT_17721 [Caulochytrium protostelioides]|eukprot:RKP02668.1 hypothetical protein CXG81DRAFT_17721 [Caulochytrium protostelioides]
MSAYAADPSGESRGNVGPGVGEESSYGNPPPSSPAAPTYTLPGILQHLQLEWRRFERERNVWEIERSDYQSRIAFLEGERRANETLKHDLSRRIQMLEYALKQERIKAAQQSKAGTPSAATAAAMGAPAVTAGASTKAEASEMTQDSLPSQPTTAVEPQPPTALELQPQPPTMAPVAEPLLGPPPPPLAATAAGSGPFLKYTKSVAHTRSREVLKNYLREVGYLLATSQTAMAGSAADGGSGLDDGGGGGAVGDMPFHTLQRAVTDGGARAHASGSVGTTGAGAGARTLQRGRDGAHEVSGGPPAANGPATYTRLLTRGATVGATPSGNYRGNGSDNGNVNGNGGGIGSGNGNGGKMPSPRSKLMRQGAGMSSVTTSTTSGITAKTGGALSLSDLQKELHVPDDRVQKVLARAGVGRRVSVPSAGASGSAAASSAGSSSASTTSTARGFGSMKENSADGLTMLSLEDSDGLGDEGRRGLARNAGWHDGAGAGADGRRVWKPHSSLRSHLDGIRAVYFVTPGYATSAGDSINDAVTLVSASEDHTAKAWCLGNNIYDSKRGRAAQKGLLLPYATFRGHTGPILDACTSGDTLYTGSLDATVRVWRVPSPETTAAYGPYASHGVQTLVGHTDAVWRVKAHPAPSLVRLVASASADGTVKLWSIDGSGAHALEQSLALPPLDPTASASAYPTPHGRQRPTAIEWLYPGVHSATQQLVVATSAAQVHVYDVQTCQPVLSLPEAADTSDGTTATQINDVVVHPETGAVMTAHADCTIRFFDPRSGRQTHRMNAHLEGVSTLSAARAPGRAGALVSGGYDASVRWWDLATHTCVQEYSGHAKRGDEGVWDVAFHPQIPGIMASGGADGTVKMYALC